MSISAECAHWPFDVLWLHAHAALSLLKFVMMGNRLGSTS